MENHKPIEDKIKSLIHHFFQHGRNLRDVLLYVIKGNMIYYPMIALKNKKNDVK